MRPGVCSAAATEAATCTCFLQSTVVILNEFPALSASSKSSKQWLHWENQLLEPTGCSCCCPLSEGTSLSYNRLQDLSLPLPLGTLFLSEARSCCRVGSVRACSVQRFPSRWLRMLLSAHRLEGELNTVKQKRAAVQSTLRRSHKEQVQPSQQGRSAA